MSRDILAALGWRVDTNPRYNQAVKDFQRGWSLGPALVVDGLTGPKTRAALQLSMQRRKEGRADFSEHFSARELACACGGTNPACRRIWAVRELVQAAEALRPLIGPYTPLRACRCTIENARVGGAKNSQHLHGAALDLGTTTTVYDLPVAAVRALARVSGIGYYDAGAGRTAVRHVDVRHASPVRTAGTPTNPALWVYGVLGNRRVIPTRPDLARPTVPTKPPPPPPLPPRSWFDMATKEDLRTVVQEEINRALADETVWRKALTSMAFFKDPTAPNRGEAPDEPRIPLGRLLELAAGAAIDATDTQAVRDAFADAVNANLAVTVTAEPTKEA